LEKIVGILRGVKEATDMVYDLFFGERRAVAAIVLHFSDLTDIYDKGNSRTLLFGSMPVRGQIMRRSIRLVAERREAFKDKTLSDILTLHKANKEIDYGKVVSVIVKKGILSQSLEFVIKNDLTRKLSFLIEKNQMIEARNLVGSLFQSKVKMQVSERP
jgi:hypothetical protein